jgi:hypothetical protein
MFAQIRWTDKRTGKERFAKVLIQELKGTEKTEYESEEEEELMMKIFNGTSL